MTSLFVASTDDATLAVDRLVAEGLIADDMITRWKAYDILEESKVLPDHSDEALADIVYCVSATDHAQTNREDAEGLEGLQDRLTDAIAAILSDVGIEG